MADTIFQKIINKEIPANIVFEDDLYLAFHDIHPQAPIHVLVIPKKPIPSINDMEVTDTELIGGLLYTAKKVANSLGLESFRLITNSGEEAGQSVFHLHIHILGGTTFSEDMA